MRLLINSSPQFLVILLSPRVSARRFSFQFMGICTICKSYDKDSTLDWLGKDLPVVLPNGVELDIVRKIDGGSIWFISSKARLKV